MNRRHRWPVRFLVLLVAALALGACAGSNPLPSPGTGGPDAGGQVVTPPSGPATDGPALDPSIFPAVGATEFITANEKEQLSAGTGDYGYRGRNGGAELGDGDYAAGADEPSARDPEPMPEPDPTREIVEADIFKLEGDILYVLNSYRGLVVIDLSVPDRPQVIGRLPFQAVPVDMYVRDGRAYIVMSDWFVYWQFDPDADPLGFHGSQVLIVDVSDPSDPRELGSLPVDGEVTDTRMVGDVLYAVSKRNPEYWRYNTVDWADRTWIVSLSIADPEDIREIDRITFQGTSTLIHVAPHAIFVAAVDPNYYLTAEGYEQETLVTYVDIADPDGDLRERGNVYIPGYIADKFKLDYHDATLRVFSQRWSNSSDMTLFAVDTGFPDELEIVDELAIAEADYGYLQATRYDGPRAFAMSYRWLSGSRQLRLHTFDLSDPRALRKAASLPIQTSISHFEVRGARLLGLGMRQDQSYSESRLQVVLYDVADLERPAELAALRLGSRYSYSSAINDYKAFRVVDDLGLVLVPLQYSLSTPPYYWQGTQIVEWTGDTLVERGQIRNVAQVKRAFVVGDRLVAFSERQLQVIDAHDLDNPVVTADLFLIRNVLDIFAVQGRQVQLVGDVENGGFFFEVLDFGPTDEPWADDRAALSRLDLPFSSAPYTIRDGDVLHLVGYESNLGQVIRNADFTDVLAPRLRGLLDFSNQVDSVYRPGYSFYYYYWNPTSGLPLAGRILPFTERHIIELPNGRREWDSELGLVDLSDVDHPRVADGRVPMNDYPFVNKVTHGTVLHSTHVEEATTADGETLYYHVRSFVDRIDVADPDAPVPLPSLNVPGLLVDVSEDGSLLYTIDYQWDDFGRRRNSLNVLKVLGDVAELMEVVPVSDQVNRAVFRDRTIWLVNHKYPWWGVQSDTVASRQPYTILEKFALAADGTLATRTSARLHGYHFDLLDVEASRVYLASGWPYGLLVLDAANPAAPQILHAARSIGYISRLVTHDDAIYTPLGWYGVHRTVIGD
jgi:hypothetical protein